MTTTATEVRVPDIGAFSDVPIIEMHVKVGDQVNEEDPLVTLESDKATMDVPAPLSGQVLDIPVKIGDQVSTGSLILTIGPGDGAVAPPPTLVEQQEPDVTGPSTPAPAAAPARVPEAARPAAAPAYTAQPGRPGGGLQRGARRAERAPGRARAGRGPDRGGGHRAQGPHHQG